jgi:hypothetical protein
MIYDIEGSDTAWPGPISTFARARVMMTQSVLAEARFRYGL